MAKELPYFKFEPAQWMFGRIQKQSGDCIKAFINLCCKYWHELGEVSLEDARLDFGTDEINSLLKGKVIKNEAGMIRIDFLDEQLAEIKQFSGAQRIRGLKSAEVRAAKKRSTTVEPKSTTVEPPLNQSQPPLNPVQPEVNQSQPIRREEIIGDKIREDKKRRECAQISFFERFMRTTVQVEGIQKILASFFLPSTPESVRAVLTEFDPTFYITYPDGDFQKYCYRFLDFVNSKRPAGLKPTVKTKHDDLW